MKCYTRRFCRYAAFAIAMLIVLGGSGMPADTRAASVQYIPVMDDACAPPAPVVSAAAATDTPAPAPTMLKRSSALLLTDNAPSDGVPIEHDGGGNIESPEAAQVTPPPEEPAAEPTPQPTADIVMPPPLEPGQPAPYILQVDVANQIVSAYGLDADGLYTVLIRQMLCSTGTKKTPTPLGKFVMPGGPRDRHKWAFFPEFKVYAKFTSRIYQGILFHSVLYKNSKTLISSSVRNLGKRASHGCIRLQVKDAQWIYTSCPPGTEVYIFDDAEYNPELVKALKAEVTSAQ